MKHEKVLTKRISLSVVNLALVAVLGILLAMLVLAVYRVS
jgi:hypothetical protein